MNTMKYHSSFKRKEILPFATSVDLEDIMLTEISQAQENNYWMILLMYEI